MEAALLARLRAGKVVTTTDVHTSHCCARHGCKYGSHDCPVKRGALAQEYLCEDCGHDVDELLHVEPRADAYAASVVKLDLEDRNYLLVDGEKVFLSRRKSLTGKKAQFADAYWAVKSAYIAGKTGQT